MQPTSTSLRAQGIAGLGVILLLALLPIGIYRQAFSDPVRVSFVAPRAGLLMVPGADVRLRGISVGRVDSVQTSGDGARLELALDSDKAALIPRDVTAQVTPTTVVGAPYVRLIAARAPVMAAIRSGAVIHAATTVPDINDLFQQTVSLLRAVPVRQLDVTLSALAAALDGRGTRLGRTFSVLDDYARDLNERTGALGADLHLTSTVSQEYAGIARPLMDLLRHSTVTGQTLVVRARDLDSLLESVDALSNVGRSFIDSIRSPLTQSLRRLDPVTALLARYSPEYRCMLQGLAHQALNNKSLGVKYPGAQAIMTLLPGQKGYKYPRDLPRFVNDRGPRCYSLPDPGNAHLPLPYRRFDDGSHANRGDGQTKVSHSPVEFFGDPKPGGSQ